MVHQLRSTYTDFIFFPVLFLFTISLPLPIAYGSIFSIVLFVVFLIDIRNIRYNLGVYFKSKRSLFLLIIFTSLGVSLIYSEDKNTAMKALVGALPLFTLPLSLSGVKNLSSKQIDILKKAFVFSCLIISLIYFIQTATRIGLWDGTYRLQTEPVGYKSSYLVYHLTYHQLTPSIHAVFFSLYLAAAVLMIVFGFRRRTWMAKILQSAIIFYFLVYLFLLTSVVINFGLYSFLIANLFFKYTFRKWLHYLLFFCLIIAGTAITDYLLIVKYIGPNIGDIFYKFDSPSINQKILLSYIVIFLAGTIAVIIKRTAQKNHRLILACSLFVVTLAGLIYLKKEVENKKSEDWKLNNITVRANYSAEAIRMIKKNPLLGVGIGDKKYELIDRDMTLGDRRYVEFGEDTRPGDVFNPHNQFFDFWIAAGIIPVICLLFFFINEFLKPLRHRDLVYLGVLYCFCLFCLTDRPLMIQRGQFFFLFFICLLEAELERKKVQLA